MVKSKNPEASSAADVNRILTSQWKAASATTKAPFEDKAKVMHANNSGAHMQLFV